MQECCGATYFDIKTRGCIFLRVLKLCFLIAEVSLKYWDLDSGGVYCDNQLAWVKPHCVGNLGRNQLNLMSISAVNERVQSCVVYTQVCWWFWLHSKKVSTQAASKKELPWCWHSHLGVTVLVLPKNGWWGIVSGFLHSSLLSSTHWTVPVVLLAPLWCYYVKSVKAFWTPVLSLGWLEL